MITQCENTDAMLALLRGKRAGLVANHTAITHNMKHQCDVLREHGVNIVALFGPEHGFYGEMDDHVTSATDPRTGLPIHSLYGPQRKPTADMLQDIDILIFSIQDIGSRFYTYISTMAHCLEAAAEYEIGFLVIDRPNPITGVHVEGNISETQSFVAVHPLPIRHGMTLGELAAMFNDAANKKADLAVARMSAWKRNLWFDETDWPWVIKVDPIVKTNLRRI